MHLMRHRHRCSVSQHDRLLPATGLALDVACGDGRNAVWMARRGLAVDAIDIAHGALQRLVTVARRERLAVHAIQADLERFPLPVDRYTLVVNVRYLQRSLLPALRRAVRPGGLIAFETFLRDQARIGHVRNASFLLDPGELRAGFAGFEALVDDEGLHETPEGPAYLARLLARRPLDETFD